MDRTAEGKRPPFPRRTAYWTVTCALCVFTTSALTAGEIVVQPGCTLVDAVHAANTDAVRGGCPAGDGPDEIRLTGDVTLTQIDNSNENGLPVITSVITIEGGGFTIGRAVGSPRFRLFDVPSSGDLTLRDVTVANGELSGDDGAGIHSVGGRVHLERSVLFGNTATGGLGAGIFNDDGEVTIHESAILENTSTGIIGSGVYNQRGPMTITSSTISGNSSGGRNGEAPSATLTIIDTVVSDNTAGGIVNHSTLQISNSTFSNNGDWAGAITNSQGTTVLLNSTLSGNHLGISNAGLYEYARVDVINSTIVGSVYAGIDNECPGFGCYPEDSLVVLSNSIIASSGDLDCDGAGQYTDLGGNLDDDGTCPSIATIGGLDPELRDNGGPTPTHALLEGSSAIDVAGSCGLLLDQRGFARDPGACDSGAFEFDADPPTGPTLAATGTCPGEVVLELTGATPGGTVAVVRGTTLGFGTIPGGACEGLELGISDAALAAGFVTDESGAKTIEISASAELCGLLLQAVDVAECTAGAVTVLPG